MYPSQESNSDAGASGIFKWIAYFGCREWLMMYQSSHFVSSIITSLTQEARFKPHYTPLYSPWANRTIECLCREIIRVARSLLSDRKLSARKLNLIIEVIRKVVNRSLLNSLGRNQQGRIRCLMKIFTGLRLSPLLLCPRPLKRYNNVKKLLEVRTEEIVDIDAAYKVLKKSYKEVINIKKT